MAELSATFAGSIPEYYDACLGPAWFDAFAQDLVARLPSKPPGDVLEIACGTGLLSRRVRERLEPGVRFVATDLSKAMLDFARAKLPGASVEWREADAAKLPFADGEFGAVLCSFGVMFVPDRRAAFREARRVLKSGGIFLFNVWDRIEENTHGLAHAQLIEELFPGDQEVRFRTPFEMHDPALLRSLLAESGFRETRLEKKSIRVEGSARSIALGQIRGTPRSLLLEKRGANLDDVVNGLASALAGLGGDPFRGHAQAIVVEAQAVEEARVPVIPQIQYARSGDVNVAYQVFGAGPIDLVVVPGWISCIETFWEEPGFTRFLQRLGSFARVLLFDKRGTGLSDRVTDTPTLEERMDDVRAVMDAVGSKRAALLGYSEGGPMCALFAVTYPERTEALIMVGSFACNKWAEDYPHGRTAQQQKEWLEEIRTQWGGPVGLATRIPTLANDERVRNWWAKMLRTGGSPSTVLALSAINYDIDVRHVLGSICVPTLLIHPSRDRAIPVELGRYMAERIRGAKLIEIDSDDHVPFIADPTGIPDTVREFLIGGRGEIDEDRVVKTVMFSDIVGSTELATKLGDARWRDLREAHHATVRRELAIHRGQEVDTAGDGFYAAFDGPARAIRCACEVRNSVKPLGLSVRVGLHTGECVISGEKIAGVAVHIGARVAALAPPDTVLVSQTVKDLVAGSGLEFEDFGLHGLKGISDRWHLYAVKHAAVSGARR